jgi:hypothetical protein
VLKVAQSEQVESVLEQQQFIMKRGRTVENGQEFIVFKR